jgi:predicted nucleic acid-binding Zn ribbon protein
MTPADPMPEPAFLVSYRCPDCGEEWEDVWDSACDDDCGACGACGARAITPVAAEPLPTGA